jgi:hypothetical protein
VQRRALVLNRTSGPVTKDLVFSRLEIFYPGLYNYLKFPFVEPRFLKMVGESNELNVYFDQDLVRTD